MKVIYSKQRSSFKAGYDYRNPQFFQGPMTKDLKEVTVIGDYPEIVAAYTKLGFDVKVVRGRAENYVPPLPVGVLPAIPTDLDSPGDENLIEEPGSVVLSDETLETDEKKQEAAQILEPHVPQLHELQKVDLQKLCEKRNVYFHPFWGPAKLIRALQGNG